MNEKLMIRLLLLIFCFFVVTPVYAQQTYIHQLTWQDNSDNEDGFKVERRSGPTDTFGEIATVGSNIITYQDVVGDGQERCYRVLAFNSAGNSAYSNVACGMSLPPQSRKRTLPGTTGVACLIARTYRGCWNH